MTSKERLMLALKREKPDRLPVSIHQWQGYHLDEYMNGISDLEAFEKVHPCRRPWVGRGGLGRGPDLSRVGVCGVAQAVAHKVKGQDDDDDRQAGEEEPGRLR